MPETFRFAPIVEEEVMLRFAPEMYPADTPARVEVPVTFKLPPALRFPDVVMKPWFVMPFEVVVPETFNAPWMVELEVVIRFAVEIRLVFEMPSVVVVPSAPTEKRVDVAPAFTILKRSPVCPWVARMTSGIWVVEVDSRVSPAREYGEVVPINTSDVGVVSCTIVPVCVHPVDDWADAAHTAFPEVQTRCPLLARMFPVTSSCPENVDVAVFPEPLT